MQYIQGINRTQAVMFAPCLDDIIDSSNEVRLIDAFVNSINLTDFNFTTTLKKEGRPPIILKHYSSYLFTATLMAFVPLVP